MNQKRTSAIAVALVAVLLAASGCGKTNKVGDAKTLGAGKEQAGGRLGENSTTTTTTVASATTAKPATVTTAKPVATTAKPATPPPVTVAITSTKFDPANFSVRVGTPVKVVNNDTQAHTFTSDQAGLFDSGPIAPGASYTYPNTKVGKFNFHDETRPYVIGQIEVTA